MREHGGDYSFYVGEEPEWHAYLRRMSQPKTWGDELTLRAASDAYRIVVHVVTTERENWLLNYASSSLKMEGGDGGKPPQGTRECFLAYVSPIHYNVVIPSHGSGLRPSRSGY